MYELIIISIICTTENRQENSIIIWVIKRCLLTSRASALYVINAFILNKISKIIGRYMCFEFCLIAIIVVINVIIRKDSKLKYGKVLLECTNMFLGGG